MISVIIPAHNEAQVIKACLSGLVDGAETGELEIVVVCNGCTDDTAQIARSFGRRVTVIETDEGSKPLALNLGDERARAFPRFYIDADIEMRLSDLHVLASYLEKHEVLAVAPLPLFNTRGCSWPVKAYYYIHERLPAYGEGIGGSGVYGMSEEGRKRFKTFPRIIADDGYVRLQFASRERLTVREVRSVVHAPKTVRELIAIKTRSYLGNVELKQQYPHLWPNVGVSNKGVLARLFLKPWLWPDLLAYITIKLATRWRAGRYLNTKHPMTWERDETSRLRHDSVETHDA